MNTTSAVLLSGVLVTAGRWQEGHGMESRVVVGVVVLALILSAMPDEVARPFAFLILIAAAFRYGHPLAKSVSS